MPSVEKAQHGYHRAGHQRLDAPAQAPSPPASAVYLPASTYTSPPKKSARTHTLSISTNFPTRPSDGMDVHALQSMSSTMSPDPSDFYRQYQGVNGQAGESGYGEDSINVIDGPAGHVRSRGNSAAHERPERPPSTGQLLKTRKSSIRDLVAKFDSPVDEIPPVPPPITGSRTLSRTVSPTMTANLRRPSRSSVTSIGHDEHPRLRPDRPGARPSSTQPMRLERSPRVSSTSAAARSVAHLPTSSTRRQPLFGEVTSPTTGATGLTGAGYGIHHARRRRGSEGSPMHSPNPMFPVSATETEFSPVSPTARYTSATVAPGAHATHDRAATAHPTSHRRAQSDLATGMPSRDIRRPSVHDLPRPPTSDAISSTGGLSTTKIGIVSRIPVSKHRSSATSDSGQSASSSRTPSALDRPLNIRTISGPAATNPLSPPKSSSPQRAPRTPHPPTTLGTRSTPTPAQTQKSPSLRANIIVPPPKISPPLRSSRPRQPVSSATTAASRAKMAEKFASLQKQNAEGRNATGKPQRPPELRDIDLEARRSRITQALDRSRSQQEHIIRKSSRQLDASQHDSDSAKTVSPRDVSQSHDLFTSPTIPEVIVNRVSGDEEAEVDEFQTPLEEMSHERHLPIIVTPQGESEPAVRLPDADSPTLGDEPLSLARYPSLLQTHYDHAPRPSEPASAVTVDTETTNIDTEPQGPFTRPKSPTRTVLSQIMHMRGEPSPGTPPSGTCSESGDNTSDHADEMSVQIMLRNTRYLEDEATPGVGHSKPPANEAYPELPWTQHHDRGSWTSSIPDTASDDDRLGPIMEASPDPRQTHFPPAVHDRGNDAPPARQTPEESVRSTMASDAYTIVNFVLQQHAVDGRVEHNLVDDMLQRVLEQSPQLLSQPDFDADRVQELTLAELEKIRRQELGEGEDEDEEEHGDDQIDNTAEVPPQTTAHDAQPATWPNGHHETDGDHAHLAAVPSVSGHRHQASLNSVTDWAHTSPSVGDWMHFATNMASSPEHERASVVPDRAAEAEPALAEEELGHAIISLPSQTLPTWRRESYDDGLGLDLRSRSQPSLPLADHATPRRPTQSPPPPPTTMRQADRSLPSPASSSHYGRESRSATFGTGPLPPPIPRRMTSLSQITTQSRARAPSTLTTAESRTGSPGRPSLDQPSGQSTSRRSSPTPEQKKLKQRRHVIQELVETEDRYYMDMSIISDLYVPTAESAMTADDVRVLFGNTAHVVQFSKTFLDALKRGAKPVYTKDPADRFRSAKESVRGTPPAARSSTSLSLPGDVAAARESDMPDVEKDRLTHVAEAFQACLPEMEAVYAEYLKNHHAASQRLQVVQQTVAGGKWLEMCQKETVDLTTAWNLDSLLVKPVQRIMKYPLLLKTLLDATPDDHPEYYSLKAAAQAMVDVNNRINQAKKHTELVGSALHKNRKESEGRKGLSKVLGRQTEKLRQNMGISEMYEDAEYSQLRSDFEENTCRIIVVGKDYYVYEEAIKNWVQRLCDVADAGDKWVDVGHTPNAAMESKLRQFAMVTWQIKSMALPDHLAQVQKKVFEPIQSAERLLAAFQSDSKGLLAKREKRLIDYAQYKNKKDRGDRLDKKTLERMEQWEALNLEAKQRMRKLMRLTRDLCQACLTRLLPIQMAWMDIIRRKLSAAMALTGSDGADIEREWQVDFDFQEASALTLGICNGSLVAEAVNMMGFITPSSTLNGMDSPRQPSWTSGQKRSISLHSEGSHHLPWLDSSKHTSASFSASPLAGDEAYTNGRIRATSTTSGKHARPADGRVTSHHAPASAAAHARPSASPRPGSSRSPLPPRVSLDAPDPHLGPLGPLELLRPDSPANRPESGSTFFSAPGAPGTDTPNAPGRGSGLFSSAMPLSDSPSAGQFAERPFDDPKVLFAAASVYEFNIDRSRREAGFPYLTYVAGEIFDVIGERGELWLAKNQDDPHHQFGWIWNKHFARLAG